MTSVVLGRRFNGPASSGNGGYTAGLLAEASGLSGPVTVHLRLPPPLEVRLQVVPTEGAVELRHQDVVVATAVPGGPETWEPTSPVAPDHAQSLEAAYAGFRSHPFPQCFSCGPDRADGLRIFPGRLDADRVAASWTPADDLVGPDGRADVPVTWAALDCVSAWSSDLEHRPLVLASMTARYDSRPQAGTAYAVVGTLRRIEGRKTWTASHLFDGNGRLVAQAEQLWIAVDPTVVARLQAG